MTWSSQILSNRVRGRAIGVLQSSGCCRSSHQVQSVIAQKATQEWDTYLGYHLSLGVGAAKPISVPRNRKLYQPTPRPDLSGADQAGFAFRLKCAAPDLGAPARFPLS